MNDFYCPYCECGMDRDEIFNQVHEDDHIGEWDVKCVNCKEVFELKAEPSIDYSTDKKGCMK